MIKKENSKERKVVLTPGKITATIEEEAEAEITELAKGGRYSRLEICHLREDSFRQMKAEGARWAAAQSVPAAHIAEKSARAVRVRVAA